jgi:hypothetical protein
MDPDPHQSAKLDTDPHPHQSDYQDPDQFADGKPKCMEYEPICALFQGFEPLLQARIQIRICNKLKDRIRIQNAPKSLVHYIT